MFAVLGEIQFEVVGSPQAYDSAGAYEYSEQRVIESKPRLQWVGDELDRLHLELIWHASFTNPAAQLALLRATAAQHLALPLVFGDGGFRGFFVVEAIVIKSQQLSAGGVPIAIRVALSLKEWAVDSLLLSGTSTAAGPTPLAIATSSTGTASGNSAPTPGVSALVRIPTPAGTGGPDLAAGDVSAAVVVRSATR
jgi:phage protein U